MINFPHVLTKDHLRLLGVHFAPENKSDTCILFIHGMGGNFIDNFFAESIGKRLADSGYGFIYSHNRGFNQKTSIPTDLATQDGSYETVLGGAMYEKFPDCLLDIETWIEEAKRLGYSKIILAGHSLGVKKIIYWNWKREEPDLKGVILLSPPDLEGLIKKNGQWPLIETLAHEARELVKIGKPLELLSKTILNKYQFSAQTFLSHFEDKAETESLPIYEQPEHFIQLEKIVVPVLALMGTNDFVAIRSPQEDLELIKSKAVNCPQFSFKTIPEANHNYHWQEEVLAKEVLEWVRHLI